VSRREPTAEQRAAIEAEASNVLVEAGAGTGKTGTIVDRYCRLVCEQGVPPDSVLAFTFTDKAAAELRQRIRAEVERRAVAGSERAAELLPRLGGAWVTTIHGFCNRLLAAHPVAVGVDPGFRVLDAAETERAAAEAFDEALEDFFDEDDPGRERTVAAFDVGGLRATVLGVHAELRSRGEDEPRLPDPGTPDVEGALAEAARVAAETLAELKPNSANHELVERAAVLLAADGPPALDEIAALRTRSKAKPMVPYKEAIEAAVSRVAEAGEGGLAYRHVAELLALFSARFAAAKERRAGVDFEDLQLLAVRLLERETGTMYRSRFGHILVDEFQDTNRLQLRLIEALRGPRTQVTAVGDELQSIYGFRHADLDVFRERREAIEGGAGEAIPLSGNFRSRPEAIGAVNAIGERLLEDYAPLRVGALPARPHPLGEGPAVELLLTGRDGWNEEGIELDPVTDARTPLNQLAEARFLAARLRELADQGVERAAMVVLLRAFTRLDAYEDSLERAGLRPYVVGGRGYWSQQQVADVCALLATIANPLDDQALFGALASPACGVAPDTLWLLRAAAGEGRHLWPAIERAAGGGSEEAEIATERLERIPVPELELIATFAARIEELRRQAVSLSLAGLIEAAVSATGYDLAVLMKPAGEARFANVRKLMRLAAEYEAAEGRDLRGLLDFLAARADADADAQAATALEGHDGVRIMTVHSAKGLEFDVVAIPHLSRPLLAQVRAPLLAVGREPDAPRVGLQLRRLGARAVDLYAQRELLEEAQRREAEEELRLFHVGATRARERLLLSGVVRPSPPSRPRTGEAVVERIVATLEIDRERDSTVSIPPPEPRPGLEAAFEPSEIAVRVNLASAERSRELAAVHRELGAPRDPGTGPAPLIEARVARRPRLPLSYTAISEFDAPADGPIRQGDLDVSAHRRGDADREEGAARGIAVHELLEWSARNGWREPAAAEELLAPVRAWLGSDFFAERVREVPSRAEVPLLVEVADTVLRGSIDLLVEQPGSPPLIVDYKTDRLGDSSPAERAAHYAVQRDIYAFAVSDARGATEVEVAYVFLERPDEPVVALLDSAAIAAGRKRIEEAIERIAGEDAA